MTARTHNAFAVASLVTAATFFPPEKLNVLTLVGSVVAVNVGALLPDMDQTGNNLWNLFPARKNFGRVFRRIFYKHRTLTHSIVGGYLLYKLLEFVLPRFLNPAFVNPHIILASIMIGYLSHLISDSITEEGIPLLFPINLNFGIPPIRSWRIKTGKWFENFIIYPAVWIYVLWLIYTYRDSFMTLFKGLYP